MSNPRSQKKRSRERSYVLKPIVKSVNKITQGYTEGRRLFVSTTKENAIYLEISKGWNSLNDYVEIDSIQHDGRSIVGKKGD